MNVPSVSDKIDFSKYVFPNDPSGVCMIHIPYNMFHIFREQGKQEVYRDLLKEVKESGKKLSKIIEDKMEKEKC